MKAWLAAAIAALNLVAGIGHAQTYPDRTVRMIVPFTAGGGTDLIARLVAQKLTDKWGQPVVVENVEAATRAVLPNSVAACCRFECLALRSSVKTSAAIAAASHAFINASCSPTGVPLPMVCEPGRVVAMSLISPMRGRSQAPILPNAAPKREARRVVQ